jgi:arginine decarboxylase
MRPRGVPSADALLSLARAPLLGRTPVVIGCRIPKDFFVTSGVGESDITIHAGSFHLALREANIEHLNVMKYSSILPAIARQVPFNPRTIPHGSVMETIMAEKSVQKGERATAAIIWGWLIDRETKERFGGLVCEYSDTGTEEEARASLRASLQELYENGYSERFILDEENIQFHSRSIIAKKNFGTALVTLGFVNYEVPVMRGIEDT